MKPTVYIETTVIGYLTAWPRKDPVVTGQQRLTREWWQKDRHSYEMFTSEVVRAEAAAGDAKAAEERLHVLDQIPILMQTEQAKALARALIVGFAIPQTEERDAFHVAIAATNGIDYLLTWNCRHLANANLRFKIESVCRDHRYEPPIICTPEQLRKEPR